MGEHNASDKHHWTYYQRDIPGSRSFFQITEIPQHFLHTHLNYSSAHTHLHWCSFLPLSFLISSPNTALVHFKLQSRTSSLLCPPLPEATLSWVYLCLHVCVMSQGSSEITRVLCDSENAAVVKVGRPLCVQFICYISCVRYVQRFKQD